MFIYLCKLNQIDVNSTKGFSLDVAGKKDKLEIFLARNSQGLFGYTNQCPHTLVNLNWQADQFLNYDKNFIQCSMHGALFRVHDGLCIWGPCQGQSLISMNINIKDEDVMVDIR